TARLERWRAAVALPAGPDATGVLDAVRERLADDLDAPGALNAVDAWADAALAGAAAVDGVAVGFEPVTEMRPSGGADAGEVSFSWPSGDVAGVGREAPALVSRLVDTLLGVDLEPVRPTGS
ncbi:hypothetical protein ND747_03825, partial [Frankia sp. R82]|nr:hypothetical protein [Frankia sp. R82]